jgi:TATA-box binding protein (TBP) (component of TFIID and TFIIIB)
MGSLNISTMTVTTNMPCSVHLKQLYENIRITDTIRYIELSKDMNKGISSKKPKKKRKKTKQSVFFNQLTFNIYYKKIINLKIFNNGRIQMTGLKRLEWGKEAVRQLITQMFEMDQLSEHKSMYDCKFKNKKECLDHIDSHYKIALINSDFHIGYKINRDQLHNRLIDHGIFSSFEACNYPGVNIKYYINNLSNDGICHCTEFCNGKGNGCGEGDCKRVTIAVFYSGSIIITGGDFNQLFEAHDFICDFIEMYKDEIKI